MSHDHTIHGRRCRHPSHVALVECENWHLIVALQPLAQGSNRTADFDRARDLLNELGEKTKPPVMDEKSRAMRAQLDRIAGCDPAARCRICGGIGQIYFSMLLAAPCTACQGTGRRLINDKPYYTAAELAARWRSDDRYLIPA